MLISPPKEYIRTKSSLVFFIFIMTLFLQDQGLDIGIAITINFFFAVLFVIFNFQSTKFGRAEFFFLLFLIWASISSLYNIVINPLPFDTGAGLGLRYSQWRIIIHLGRLIFLFLFFLTLKEYFLRYSELAIKQIIHGLIIASSLAFLYGNYQLIAAYHGWPAASLSMIHKQNFMPYTSISDTEGILRLFSTFGEPKGYAYFLIFAIPLLLGYFLSKEKMTFWSKALLVGMLIHLFATFSRGGWIALAVILIVLATIHKMKISLYIAISFLIIFLICSFAFGLSPIDFLMSLFAFGEEIGTHKIYIYTASGVYATALKSPIFGYGPGGLAFHSHEFLQYFPSWLMWINIQDGKDLLGYLLGSTGIIGSILFLLFVGIIFYDAIIFLIKNRRKKMALCPLHIFIFASSVGVWLLFAINISWNELYPFITLAMLSAFDGRNSKNIAYFKIS